MHHTTTVQRCVASAVHARQQLYKTVHSTPVSHPDLSVAILHVKQQHHSLRSNLPQHPALPQSSRCCLDLAVVVAGGHHVFVAVTNNLQAYIWTHANSMHVHTQSGLCLSRSSCLCNEVGAHCRVQKRGALVIKSPSCKQDNTSTA